MRVKDVLICAMEKLNAHALAEKFAAGETPDEYENETVSSLLCCYNAVENELARRYLPLIKKEKFFSRDGAFPYSKFTRVPLSIRKVTSNGENVSYTAGADGVYAKAESVEIEYCYSPEKKGADGFTECAPEAGEQLLSYGVAAEYCFINGEAALAAGFENRYRQAIDGAQSKLRCRAYLPPRRWV